MKSVGSIWFKLFELLSDYMNEILYPIIDTGLEVIRIADKVEKDGDYSYINENIVGYTFVKEDNSIYDENKTLIQVLDKGFKFKLDDIDYFLPSILEVRELGLQWNNTRIGDYGISLEVGGFEIDEVGLTKLWRTPQLIFELGEESNIDVMEREGNTSSDFKQLTFDIIMLVSETDLYSNKTGYSEINRVETILNNIIYDFTQTKNCSRQLPLMKWTYNLKQIYMDRPMVISSYTSTISYR